MERTLSLSLVLPSCEFQEFREKAEDRQNADAHCLVTCTIILSKTGYETNYGSTYQTLEAVR